MGYQVLKMAFNRGLTRRAVKPHLLPRPHSVSSSVRSFCAVSTSQKYDEYRHPLVTRYASPNMRGIWSERRKFSNWRRLWIALAQAELELGVPGITQSMVDEMESVKNDIDFNEAELQERRLRHDVMAHIHTFGKQAPSAAGIIHMGATSCFVQDNGDLLQLRDGANLVCAKLLRLMAELSEFAMEHRNQPCLAYTHLQPAQLTTVGKRAALWLQDLHIDYTRLRRGVDELPFRGVKGTTGTQASFLHLFDGDHSKVKSLDRRVCELMGFPNSIPLSGQTYTRKLDYGLISDLSGISQSMHKMCTDIRLLCSFQEMDEPFESTQVGSSAMAYKRNPMRSERVCSLARYMITLPDSLAHTHGSQWMERTLDDSALRRIVLAESMLATDAILDLGQNIANGLRVWPKVIETRMNKELPFIASENILMESVKLGGDRQMLHEQIRVHSMESARRMKEEGSSENDLLDRIAEDPHFAPVKSKLTELIDPIQFVGRAPEQVEEYVNDYIQPLLKENQAVIEALGKGPSLSV